MKKKVANLHMLFGGLAILFGMFALFVKATVGLALLLTGVIWATVARAVATD